MKRFIFEERNGIYIIDLAKTLQQIRNAVEVVKEIVGKTAIYSVCRNKKTSKIVVRECAEAMRRILCLLNAGSVECSPTCKPSVNRSKTLERIEKRIAAGGEWSYKERTFAAVQRSDQTR